MREVVDRIHAGAVMADRSPLNDDIDYKMSIKACVANYFHLVLTLRNDDHPPLCCCGTFAPSCSGILLDCLAKSPNIKKM